MGLNIPPDLDQPPGLPGQAHKEHEFDIIQNDTIGGLAGWMGFVGIMLIIFGGLYCVLGLLALPAGILAIGEGVCVLLMGVWLWGASRSFKLIVTTEGMDITLLMDALKKLRGVYTMQGVLLIILIALMAIVIFLSFGRSGSAMM